MLIDVVVSLVLIVALVLLIASSDDAMTLFFIGWLSIGVGIAFETVFNLSETSLSGFGVIFKALWIFIGINAFVKIIHNPKDMFDNALQRIRRQQPAQKARQRT